MLRQYISFCQPKSYYSLIFYFHKTIGFAAHAAAGHFLLPIAAKESKSAFRLPKQKALITQKFDFITRRQ